MLTRTLRRAAKIFYLAGCGGGDHFLKFLERKFFGEKLKILGFASGGTDPGWHYACPKDKSIWATICCYFYSYFILFLLMLVSIIISVYFSMYKGNLTVKSCQTEQWNRKKKYCKHDGFECIKTPYVGQHNFWLIQKKHDIIYQP